MMIIYAIEGGLFFFLNGWISECMSQVEYLVESKQIKYHVKTSSFHIKDFEMFISIK